MEVVVTTGAIIREKPQSIVANMDGQTDGRTDRQTDR